jgi:hypothetical protein
MAADGRKFRAVISEAGSQRTPNEPGNLSIHPGAISPQPTIDQGNRKDLPMREPASIRYNNPGAMWGGSALAKKWGANQTVGLNDGMGQGNNIAVFPTKVKGAAAQFDLWHSSKRYNNKRLQDAIHTWSGGNYVSSYVAFLMRRVPGLTPDTVINDAFLNSGQGLAMMKAQAWHEAGKPYPMTDAEWREAQALVFKPKSVVVKDAAKKTGPVIAGGAAAETARQAGLSIGWIIAIGVAVAAIAAFAIWRSRQ